MFDLPPGLPTIRIALSISNNNMTGFTSKKIATITTLGEKLSKHRHQKGLTPEKAARLINVNIKYIQDIEKNNYLNLPADIYTINILREYATLLNLNPATVVELFEKEKNLYNKTRKNKEGKKITFIGKVANLFLNPRVIKYGIIVLLLISILSYIGIEVDKAISPPPLTIDSPADNIAITVPTVEIKGHTDKEVSLTINNRPLLSDKAGNFYLQLDLQKGLNIIKISAQKKYSKETTVYRRIIVE